MMTMMTMMMMTMMMMTTFAGGVRVFSGSLLEPYPGEVPDDLPRGAASPRDRLPSWISANFPAFSGDERGEERV